MSSAIKPRSTKTKPDYCRTTDRKIQSGEFKVGEKIPTELELIETFEVSRSVIREAITELRSLDLSRLVTGLVLLSKSRLLSKTFCCLMPV